MRVLCRLVSEKSIASVCQQHEMLITYVISVHFFYLLCFLKNMRYSLDRSGFKYPTDIVKANVNDKNQCIFSATVFTVGISN